MSEVVKQEAKDLSTDDLEEAISTASQAHQGIVQTLTRARTDMWELSARFHDFHENSRWRLLGGYDTLNDWLADSDIGFARSTFFGLVRMWEQLVVLRGADVEELKGVDWTKLQWLLPYITSNKVDIATAVADAKTLGHRDIREKYPSERKQIEPPSEDPDPAPKTPVVDAPDSEPIQASEVQTSGPEDGGTVDFDPDTARYGHFDGPEDQPDVLIDAPDDVWDWVRCPSCSALHRVGELLSVEPDEVNEG